MSNRNAGTPGTLLPPAARIAAQHRSFTPPDERERAAEPAEWRRLAATDVNSATRPEDDKPLTVRAGARPFGVPAISDLATRHPNEKAGHRGTMASLSGPVSSARNPVPT